ncbi:MAG: Dickkopf N-terminal cysteine-rich domain-containing protein [Candidatus Andersenbacteria bacterium]
MRGRYPSQSSQSGFTFVEVIVATFVLGVVTVGIMGLATLGIRYSFENERQNVAQALVNQQMEVARSLRYDDVGYLDAVGREPDGAFERLATLSRNQQAYDLTLVVELVDDPANGQLPAGTIDESTADYKQVTAHAAWASAGGGTRTVSATTIISKGSILCTPGAPGACLGGAPIGDGVAIPNIDCPSSGVCPPTPPPPPPPSPTPTPPPCPPGAAACPECTADAHCAAGEVCDLDTNICEDEPGACRTLADCTGGQVCEAGQCVPSCSDDADCGSGKICNVNTGICTLPCNGGGVSCPLNLVCNPENGLCENPPTPTPLPACIGNGCSGGAWCDPGEGTCKPPCDSDIQCGYGQVCSDNGDGSGQHCENDGPPDGECTSDNECPSGQECSNGTCGGSWCSPSDPIIICNQPTLDPGCSTSANCALGGRWVTNYELEEHTSYDPICGSYTWASCAPKTAWAACPSCDDPPTSRQCSDNADNEPVINGVSTKDGYIDAADPGCYAGWDITNPNGYDPDDNHEINGECSDGLDNDGDGRADYTANYLGSPYPADPKCSSYTDASESDGEVDNCILKTYNGHDYLFCPEQVEWFEAAVDPACASKGYRLVKINTDGERDWLYDEMQEHFGGGSLAWVGASQDQQSQDNPRLGWKWVNGDALDELSNLWHREEPNDCCGGDDDGKENNEENVAQFGWDGSCMADVPREQTAPYICENDVDDPVEEISAVSCSIPSYPGCEPAIGPGGHLYYFCDTNPLLSVNDAVNICENHLGQHLTVLNGNGSVSALEEAAWVYINASAINGNPWWVGLVQADLDYPSTKNEPGDTSEDPWWWYPANTFINGVDPLWAQDEPNNAGEEDFVEIGTYGGAQLNDTNGSGLKPFVCEYRP